MASQMATPSYTPEAHEEVDFMSMFMSQQTSDDMGAQEQQQPQYTMPALPASDPIQVFDSLPVDMSTHAYGMYEPYAPIPAPIPAPAQYKIEQPTPRPATAPSTVATPYSQPGAPSTPPPAIQTQQSLVSSPTAIESTSNVTSPVTTEAAAEPARQPGRRKRKLTPEDKRRICEIYRNSQGKIRQEDIAKEYSVDRSTISKILNQEERWLDPDAPGANALLARRPGGRYPAIEEEMHRWLDEAVMHGREIRDSEAREEALRIGLRLGHPHFQASSKWWDGVKRRRAEEGRPMPTARRHALTPPMGMPGLVRSYSAMGMDPYPRDMFPAMGVAGPSQYFIPSHMQPYPAAIRSRSQSSPQVIPAGPGSYASQPSSFGPAPRQRFSPGRHANAAALRQWTFPNAKQRQRRFAWPPHEPQRFQPGTDDGCSLLRHHCSSPGPQHSPSDIRACSSRHDERDWLDARSRPFAVVGHVAPLDCHLRVRGRRRRAPPQPGQPAHSGARQLCPRPHGTHVDRVRRLHQQPLRPVHAGGRLQPPGNCLPPRAAVCSASHVPGLRVCPASVVEKNRQHHSMSIQDPISQKFQPPL